MQNVINVLLHSVVFSVHVDCVNVCRMYIHHWIITIVPNYTLENKQTVNMWFPKFSPLITQHCSRVQIVINWHLKPRIHWVWNHHYLTVWKLVGSLFPLDLQIILNDTPLLFQGCTCTRFQYSQGSPSPTPPHTLFFWHHAIDSLKKVLLEVQEGVSQFVLPLSRLGYRFNNLPDSFAFLFHGVKRHC